MSTLIPQAWIISEKNRREKEVSPKEQERIPLPISLPVYPDIGADYLDSEKLNPPTPTESSVVIIEL